MNTTTAPRLVEEANESNRQVEILTYVCWDGPLPFGGCEPHVQVVEVRVVL